jgi:hypothetical protein
MQNNISRINTIYKSLLSLLVLISCGLGLFVYFVDPFINYTAPYQLFIIFTVILFLAILFIILHFKIKVFKNLIFLQEVYKYAFNSLVFAASATFFLLLIYTNSLNLISFEIFCISILGYCIFEFLE